MTEIKQQTAQPERINAYLALQTTPIGRGWELGDKLTNTEARRLVCEVRSWARQYDAPDARALVEAMDGMERLFVRVWTEIDESLCLLDFASRAKTPERAIEQRATAMSYLHRWQDRSGRMGNAS